MEAARSPKNGMSALAGGSVRAGAEKVMARAERGRAEEAWACLAEAAAAAAARLVSWATLSAGGRASGKEGVDGVGMVEPRRRKVVLSFFIILMAGEGEWR